MEEILAKIDSKISIVGFWIFEYYSIIGEQRTIDKYGRSNVWICLEHRSLSIGEVTEQSESKERSSGG